ncbi:MAG: histidine phosphatase family protein [Akkermansiaceae bacterium]|nr:histidine phosphatase family protein [Armatimonadota bacterium]
MSAILRDEAAETNLYFIRHGQAVVNVTKVMGGPKGDTGLTLLGRTQAERLRRRLASGEIQADVLIASSLPRARETAELIAPALGLPVLLDDDLHELRVGPDADGLPLEEYIRRFGWVEISDNPLIPVDPNGESWARFMLRVGEALTRIARDYRGKTVVLVCHGGVIDGSLVHFFGMNAHAFPPARLHTLNTSLTHWTYSSRNGKWHWRLNYYNDTRHLEGLTATAVFPDTEPVATEQPF